MQKFIIRRIEGVNQSGISKKSGKPYTLDFTNVVVELPVENNDAIGVKEFTYQYGDHTNFEKLKTQLEGRLPLECELDLTIAVGDYGNAQMVIKEIKIPPVSSVSLPPAQMKVEK
ncbi:MULTISPECIES: hypothetical protein [unclassified Moraxella]|uniref:hypothetical protein n=1 Tax=unclassified Moraxella TaxID=2685852 RepID=UPI003AF58F9A